MLSEQAVSIVLWLLPGFFCATLVRSFSPKQAQDKTQQIINAFFYTILIQAIYSIDKSGFFDSILGAYTVTVINDKQLSVSLAQYIIATLIAMVSAYFIRHDTHMSAIRWMKVSKETSRPSSWIDIFLEYDDYVIITLKDMPDRLRGRPKYYSDSKDEGLIFLYEPCWLDKNNQETAIAADGLLVPNLEDILLIEFHKEANDEATRTRKWWQPWRRKATSL